MTAAGRPSPEEVAAGLPPEVREAMDAVEVACEWVERAFGSLLDAHHRTGRAQILLLEAADAMEAVGQDAHAARIREVAARDVLPGRWTYRMVDEFRAMMIEPVRAMEEAIRSDVTGGVRHVHEMDMRRRTREHGAAEAAEGAGE
ncbi:MAG: hypothetical protein RIB67_12060 [Miltoncostaeaceae bacterium]